MVYNYSVNNIPFIKTSHIKDLSILFDEKLKFVPQINEVANKTCLGFILKTVKDFMSLYFLMILFTTSVRSDSEYSSTIRSPYYKAQQ